MKKIILIIIVISIILIWFTTPEKMFYEQMSCWENDVFYQLYRYKINKSSSEKLDIINDLLIELDKDYQDALKHKSKYKLYFNNKYVEIKHKILLAKAYCKKKIGESKESENILQFQIPDLLKINPNTVKEESIFTYATIDSYKKLKKVWNDIYVKNSIYSETSNGDFIDEN